MNPETFKDVIQSSLISRALLEQDPLTLDQKKLKCYLCAKPLGWHMIPYLKCPTTKDPVDGFWRFSKRRTFRPYKDQRLFRISERRLTYGS